MEIFVLAIAFSLIFFFFLAKIISLSSSPSPNCCEYDHMSGLKPCKDFIRKVVLRDNACVRGSEGEKREGEDLGELKQENILLEGLSDNSFGSCDNVEIDENENQALNEVELPDVMERVVGDLGGASLCGESENFAKLGTDLTNDKVGVAKNEVIEVSESKCGYETVEANKNEEREDDCKCSIFDFNEILVDKSNFFESENIAKIKSELGISTSEEIEVLESKCDNEIDEGNKNEEDDVKEVLFDEDEDWERIEITELERLFCAAVAFVGNQCNADRISSIGSDVKMQLYGLHKIATVGPCHEPQPMALKVFARANWNAWKQLGNTAPEIAMEQYVTILSISIPGCIQDDIGGDNKQVSADAEAVSKLASDRKACQAGQLVAVDKRQKTCDSIPTTFIKVALQTSVKFLSYQ